MSATQKNTQVVDTVSREQASMPLQRSTPAVDIYETAEKLVLLADLPGVAEEGLNIEVVRGILTLEATVGDGERAAEKSYYRQFQLPERLDTDGGEAQLRDGLLTLTLPKVAVAQPKRIEVKTLH